MPSSFVGAMAEALKARRLLLLTYVAGVLDKDKNLIPSLSLYRAESLFADGTLPVLDLLLACGLIASKSEGRRLIEQGGINIDEQKIEDVYAAVSITQFEKGYIVIKKGKKIYHKATLQS